MTQSFFRDVLQVFGAGEQSFWAVLNSVYDVEQRLWEDLWRPLIMGNSLLASSAQWLAAANMVCTETPLLCTVKVCCYCLVATSHSGSMPNAVGRVT